MRLLVVDLLRPGSTPAAGADIRATLVEFGLTTTFMTAVFSLVRWGIGTTTPGASDVELRVRVVVVSMLVGLVIVGFASSPPGRLSGAHMNPAITLGLFASGSFPARRVLPYLAAQVTGSVAAAALTRVCWGPAVARRPTRWAVVQPGPGWTGASVALAEAATPAVIVAVMCWVTVRHHRWPLAWIVGGLFGLQGAILGTLTGGSANPARQLGPALLSGDVHLLAVYLIAPIAGALLAGGAAGRLRRRTPVPRPRPGRPAQLRSVVRPRTAAAECPPGRWRDHPAAEGPAGGGRKSRRWRRVDPGAGPRTGLRSSGQAEICEGNRRDHGRLREPRARRAQRN